VKHGQEASGWAVRVGVHRGGVRGRRRGARRKRARARRVGRSVCFRGSARSRDGTGTRASREIRSRARGETGGRGRGDARAHHERGEACAHHERGEARAYHEVEGQDAACEGVCGRVGWRVRVRSSEPSNDDTTSKNARRGKTAAREVRGRAERREGRTGEYDSLTGISWMPRIRRELPEFSFYFEGKK
jgi:hypothetical protein